jgi:hypothetical protein
MTEVPVSLSPDLRERPPHLRPWRDGWRHLRYLFMLSPTWLFGVPAIAALGMGLAILVTAVLHAVGLIGPIRFGESSIVIGVLLVSAGHMAAMMALASHLYGLREGYRLNKRWLWRLRKLMTLEACLVVGFGLIALSIIALTVVVTYWGRAGFLALPSILPVALAGLTGTLGLQTLLGGFLLAVISGNEAEFLRPDDTP